MTGFCVFIFVGVSYLASIFDLKIDVLVSRTRIASVNLVREYRFLKIVLKSMNTVESTL